MSLFLMLIQSKFSASVVYYSGIGLPLPMLTKLEDFSFILKYYLGSHISEYLYWYTVTKKFKNKTMQNATDCCILQRPIFNPTKSCFINIKTIFFFNWPQKTSMLEHNSFDKKWNDVFSNCIWNLAMQMSFTTDTHNTHTTISYLLFSYQNWTINLENTFNIDFNRGWLACFVKVLTA